MHVFPLFPLKTVLFPGGLLPLRVFEARYLDMVTQAMRDNSPFIIALLAAGEEVNSVATTEAVGVTVNIFDWESLPGGLLGITVLAESRVQVLGAEAQSDKLVMANVTYLREDERVSLPRDKRALSALLRQMLRSMPLPYDESISHYEDVGWVADRLAEALPIPNYLKQILLEESRPMERLGLINAELDKLGISFKL